MLMSLDLHQAKYAYKSIAEFVKHVTDDSSRSEDDIAFPELTRNGIDLNECSNTPDTQQPPPVSARIGNGLKSLSAPLNFGSSDKSSTTIFDSNNATTKEHIQEHPSLNKLVPPSGSLNGNSSHEDGPVSFSAGFLAQTDFHSQDELSRVVMIRQRVDLRGRVRQMEDRKDIPCLRLSANEIGLLREAPARRWLTGQQEWDQRFKDVAKKVEKRHKKYRHRIEKTLARAQELGLVRVPVSDSASITSASTIEGNDEDGRIQKRRRWGPLDLDDEDPPPSAIAARRDTVRLISGILLVSSTN